jgi:hypothetical protein
MCGSDKNSVKLYYSNGCSKQVDFKICLQRQDGTANCGITTLNPGNSSSSWGCGVTGRYWWQGRVSGSGEKFANESEINWNLR